MEERLERLTETVGRLNLKSVSEEQIKEENEDTNSITQSSLSESSASKVADEIKSQVEDLAVSSDYNISKKVNTVNEGIDIDKGTEKVPPKKEAVLAQISEACEIIADETVTDNEQEQRPLPNVVLPFLRNQQHEGSESSRFISVLRLCEFIYLSY